MNNKFAENYMSRWSARQGWNIATKLSLALRYIDEICDMEDFDNFLASIAYNEDDLNEDRNNGKKNMRMLME